MENSAESANSKQSRPNSIGDEDSSRLDFKTDFKTFLALFNDVLRTGFQILRVSKL